MHALWLLPLGVAAAGVVAVLVVARRGTDELTETVKATARVRAGIVPAVASLRRELSRSARRSRTGPGAGRR